MIGFVCALCNTLMSSLHKLQGAIACLTEASNIGSEDITQEQDEEIETLVSAVALEQLENSNTIVNNSKEPLYKPHTILKKIKLDPSIISAHLKTASADIVVASTRDDYNRLVIMYINHFFCLYMSIQRLWKQFTEFCAIIGYVEKPGDIENLVSDFPAEFSTWIAICIMSK